jgi:ADP-ribose pyrophosphatase YjhB (NUDIX family)
MPKRSGKDWVPWRHVDGRNPPSVAYGGVLVNIKGSVLLERRANRAGISSWTFPVGMPKEGEAPDQAALRTVREQTGYNARIVAPSPVAFEALFDEYVRTAFYLMAPIGQQRKTKKEMATQWLNIEDAATLIAQSWNKFRCERDLAVLTASTDASEKLSYLDRPGTCKEDWKTVPMPNQRRKIRLDFHYDDAAFSRIQKGYLLAEMEDHWFAWFEEPLLHLHRSWTGFCIYQINFTQEKCEWRANWALVNCDPDQWTSKEANDLEMIEGLIDVLLVHGPTGPRLDRMIVRDR